MRRSHDYYRALVRGDLRGPGPALQRGVLRAAAVPYSWAMQLRNVCYDRGWKRSHPAAVPVVSVGNLTLGGTGKTPCVEYIARRYRQLGYRVAILSRGYGASRGRNDEALVLEDNLPDVPHLQGADRVALATVAVVELESEVLILDDGFQHRRLARDLDVVLLDATDPWGGGYPLPRGLLREGPRSLRRAGLIVLTRCDQVDAVTRTALRKEVTRWAPNVPVVETIHQPVDLVRADRVTGPLTLLTGRPVTAFCGLGNPEAFRRTLVHQGADLTAFRTFPDHHPYTRADVDDLGRWARGQPAGGAVVTTQKDLVKVGLTQLGGRDLWAVRIRLQIRDGQEVLDHTLRSVVCPEGP